MVNKNEYGAINVQKMNKEFQAGYDCAINGANTNNCDISNFSTPDRTKAWEAGKAHGDQEKKEKGIQMQKKLQEKKPRSCRVCGCTEDDACVHPKRGNCWWVAADLCSHCLYFPGEATRYSQLK